MTEHVFADRGGKLEFVGDFETLYREESDPWGQSAREGDIAGYYENSRERIAGTLLAHEISGRGLEVGCGHGHAMQRLAYLRPEIVWDGADISACAVDQAKVRWPKLTFLVLDICRPGPGPSAYDVVLLNQVLWYILERIDAAVENSVSMLNPGGLLVVSQAFLKGEQRYGREIADGFQGTLRLFLERFPFLSLIEARHDATGRYVHNDGLLVFRKNS